MIPKFSQTMSKRRSSNSQQSRGGPSEERTPWLILAMGSGALIFVLLAVATPAPPTPLRRRMPSAAAAETQLPAATNIEENVRKYYASGATKGKNKDPDPDTRINHAQLAKFNRNTGKYGDGNLDVIKEFTFFMKRIKTNRQEGKTLDILIKYRFTIPPNYKEIRHYIASEINNTETFFLNPEAQVNDRHHVWWEEIAEALCRNILQKWRGQPQDGYHTGRITAVSLFLEVQEDMENENIKYKQPSQHGAIITIGDITPLQPVQLSSDNGTSNLVKGDHRAGSIDPEKDELAEAIDRLNSLMEKMMKSLGPNPKNPHRGKLTDSD